MGIEYLGCIMKRVMDIIDYHKCITYKKDWVNKKNSKKLFILGYNLISKILRPIGLA